MVVLSKRYRAVSVSGAALRHFLLLWSLYHNGGVSFDLNTLLLRPLPSGRYWHGSGASPACVAHFEEPRTAAGPYLLSLRAQDPVLACEPNSQHLGREWCHPVVL